MCSLPANGHVSQHHHVGRTLVDLGEGVASPHLIATEARDLAAGLIVAADPQNEATRVGDAMTLTEAQCRFRRDGTGTRPSQFVRPTRLSCVVTTPGEPRRSWV